MDKKFLVVLAILLSLVILAFQLEGSKGLQKSARMSRPGGYLSVGGEKSAAVAAAELVSTWRKRIALGKMLGSSIDPPPALDRHGKELTSTAERKSIASVASAMKTFSEKSNRNGREEILGMKKQKRRNFTIITYATHPATITEGINLATNTKKCYAEQHGYQFKNYKPAEIPKVGMVNEIYWSKLFLINMTLHEIKKKRADLSPLGDQTTTTTTAPPVVDDWAVWIDADAAITDPSLTLDDIVDAAASTTECSREEKNNNASSGGSGASEAAAVGTTSSLGCDPHIVVSNSYDGINSGVQMARLSEWSFFFLERWLVAQFASSQFHDNGPFIYAVMRELLQQQQDNLQEALNKIDQEVRGVGSSHDIPESVFRYKEECDRRTNLKMDKFSVCLECLHRSIREAVAATARAEEELSHRNKHEELHGGERHDEEVITGRGGATGGIPRRPSASDTQSLLLADTAAVWSRMSRCAFSGKPLQSAWDARYSSSSSNPKGEGKGEGQQQWWNIGHQGGLDGVKSRKERVVQHRDFEFGLMPLTNRKIGYVPGRINDGPGWKPVADWKKGTSWIFHAAGTSKEPRSAMLKKTVKRVSERFDAKCLWLI